MNITFKFVLNKRRKSANDLYPIVLRIYQGVTYSEQSLNIKIRPTDWDEQNQLVLQSNPHYQVYNAKILSDNSKLQKLILLSDVNASTTPKSILYNLYPLDKKHSIPQKHLKTISIIEYGINLVKELEKAGKAGNSMVYSCAVNKLKEYAGNHKLTFEQVNFKFLTDFSNSMLAEGIKINTISVYFRTLRAIYNRAIKEGMVPATAYPFNAFRIKNEKTVSRALTIDELKSIVNLNLPANTPIWHWRNYFMLSFCFIGINFTDLLTLTEDNIVDGRIVFRRRKTGKIYSIKIHPIATEILVNYQKPNNTELKLLLPVLKQVKDPMKLKKDVWQVIKTCNAYLNRIAGYCSIKKDITTYYARYTWANVARSLGYSKDMIAEALGHEYGNRVTGIYLDNYDNGIIDELNNSVINCVINTHEK